MSNLNLGRNLILSTILMFGCGRHFSANQAPDLTTDALTEAQNKSGRSYTSFSDPATVQSIKEQVVFTEANKAFASQILLVQKNVSSGTVILNIQWKGLSKNLIFSGKIQNQDSIFQVSLNELSGQRNDLAIKATCESLNCNSFNGLLKDQSGNLIGIILRAENRSLTLVESKPQTDSFKLLSKEKQSAFLAARKGFSVSLSSVEIYPGQSTYQITEGNDKIEGELLNIDEGVAPAKASGIFLTLGEIELIGNNQGNSDSGAELQFKITNKIGKQSLTSYLKMETNIPVLPTASPTFLKELGANALVEQILLDENNDIVKDYIASRLIPKKNVSKSNPQLPDVGGMLKYLACEEGNKSICSPEESGRDKTQTVKTMNQILREDGLPAAWSLISFMESKFDAAAYNNYSKAAGYWQFIPSTAAAPMFKLIQNGKDLRRDLKASTDAAAKYFKLLLNYWNGDVKMSVLSYNMGEGAAQKACNHGSDEKSNCNIEGNMRRNQNKQISELYDLNKKDFWKLYALHSFGSVSRNGKSGQEYVLKFLGESLVSFHPEHYGYTNRAVDLN